MTSARNIHLNLITIAEFQTLSPSTRKGLICRLSGTLMCNDYARMTGCEFTINDCSRLYAIAIFAQYNSKSRSVQAWAGQILDCIYKKLAEFSEQTRIVAEAEQEKQTNKPLPKGD